MKKKIIVIGCGFAGVFAAKKLCSFGKAVEVTVVDKKGTFDFLPMLPDVISRDIDPGYLAYPISELSRGLGFDFINEEVRSVDLENNTVSCSQRSLGYDYLIICSGSQTNFYGNNEIQANAHKLDDVKDAGVIYKRLGRDDFDTLLVTGGGYTGVEIATAAKVYLRKRLIKKRIILVERAPSILGQLPEWMKRYAVKNLKDLGIDILVNTAIEKADGDTVSLSSKESFGNAMLIWAAGVRTADFVQKINAEKNPQGRIKVDEFLRLRDNCFVAGDCANVLHKKAFLRMAVQFSIYQALSAAENIIRNIKGKGLLKYKPIDLGFIVPMANNNSCGNILGMKVTGGPATLLHFCMCIYRSLGLKNKLGVIKDLLQGGAK